MIIKKKSYKEMTAEQAARQFIKEGRLYIFVLSFEIVWMICLDLYVIRYGVHDTLYKLFCGLMFMTILLMLIHKRVILGRFVGIMISHCDLEKFLTAYDYVAQKNIFSEDLKMIRSWYSVSLIYCADYNTAKRSLLSEIQETKKKWMKVNAKANLAVLYYMYGENEEFDKLYNEIMWAINTTSLKRFPKYVKDVHSALDARRMVLVGNYDGAAEFYRKRIENAENRKSIFHSVINSIQLGDIELIRGNKAEALVAYGYAIQRAPQMTYVQSRIPKYEELKKEFSK